MELRELGSSGVVVSSIGFGGWELEGEEKTPASEARALIEASVESGANWLDTAEVYHENRNETLIGTALEGMRDEVLISSKVAPQPDGTGLRPEQVHRAARASLDRLGTDRIDIYFLHWPDEGVSLDETWGAMSELVEQGHVRAIGLSNYSTEEIERTHAQWPVDVIQQGLSMVDHLEERPVIARAGELGIGTVVYEPLASGVLSGGVSSGADIKARFGDDIEEWPFFKRLFAPGKIENTLELLENVGRIGERLGATAAEVAIAWVLHQPGVSSAICGTTNIAHVRDNAAAAEIKLSEEDLAELEALVPEASTE
ncbi:MAG: aldo/keto reductase [Actinomycetota bacterium]|nr:aldo/keto reductase [Actinomycetota bacterium]